MRIKITVLTEADVDEQQLKVVTDILSPEQYATLRREKRVVLDQKLCSDDECGATKNTMTMELLD